MQDANVHEVWYPPPASPVRKRPKLADAASHVDHFNDPSTGQAHSNDSNAIQLTRTLAAVALPGIAPGIHEMQTNGTAVDGAQVDGNPAGGIAALPTVNRAPDDVKVLDAHQATAGAEPAVGGEQAGVDVQQAAVDERDVSQQAAVGDGQSGSIAAGDGQVALDSRGAVGIEQGPVQSGQEAAQSELEAAAVGSSVPAVSAVSPSLMVDSTAHLWSLAQEQAKAELLANVHMLGSSMQAAAASEQQTTSSAEQSASAQLLAIADQLAKTHPSISPPSVSPAELLAQAAWLSHAPQVPSTLPDPNATAGQLGAAAMQLRAASGQLNAALGQLNSAAAHLNPAQQAGQAASEQLANEQLLTIAELLANMPAGSMHGTYTHSQVGLTDAANNATGSKQDASEASEQQGKQATRSAGTGGADTGANIDGHVTGACMGGPVTGANIAGSNADAGDIKAQHPAGNSTTEGIPVSTPGLPHLIPPAEGWSRETREEAEQEHLLMALTKVAESLQIRNSIAMKYGILLPTLCPAAGPQVPQDDVSLNSAPLDTPGKVGAPPADALGLVQEPVRSRARGRPPRAAANRALTVPAKAEEQLPVVPTATETRMLASRTCEHGKKWSRCKDCKGSSICPHGKVRTVCRDCGGGSICPHGRVRCKCKDCKGTSICPHDKVKSQCKECRGGSICAHGKQRTYCRECGGGSICEHGKARSKCRDCGGGSICVHRKVRSKCRECGGGSICLHRRRRSECAVCGGEGVCIHDRVKSKCRECGGVGICSHGQLKVRCKYCGDVRMCAHGRRPVYCAECRAVGAIKGPEPVLQLEGPMPDQSLVVMSSNPNSSLILAEATTQVLDGHITVLDASQLSAMVSGQTAGNGEADAQAGERNAQGGEMEQPMAVGSA